MEAVSVRQVAASSIANEFRQLNLLEGGDHRQQQHQSQSSSSGVDGEDDDNDDQIEEEKTRSEFSSQVAVERQTLESQESKGGEIKASKLSRLSREEPEKLHEWLTREIEGRFNHQSSATLDKSNSTSGHYTTGATDSVSVKKRTSFLEALIEGRKSWLDQKTVIVDINNGRRALNHQVKTSTNKDKGTESDDNPDVKKTQHNELRIQNSKTLAANKQSKSTSARKKEGTAESKESSSSKKDTRNQDKLIAVAEGESAAAAAGAGASTGTGTGGDVEVKDKQDLRKEQSEVNGKEADNRQQVQPRTTIEAAKERRLPTFGGTPSRITRLPYYSYYGKARNVEIVTAANRKDRLEPEQSSDSASGSSGSASQRSSSSPASGSKIPTLSQVSAFGSGAGGAARGTIGGVESEIDQEDRRELELTRRSQRQYRTAGYSNISNLFPAKQMNNRQDSHRQQDQQSAASGTTAANIAANSRKNLRFSSTERDRARQQGKSSSLLNLTSPQSGRARSTDRYRVGSTLGSGSSNITSGFNRRNSLSSYTHNYRTNRSMNSLNASPYSNASDNNNILPATGNVAQVQQTGTGAAMRRQNSNASYVNNKQRPPSSGYQGRSASASGYIGRNQHHRSPSASSLHYGSAGVSPYGPPPVDPDCPVHGYSPVNGMHSKSSQHLAGNADSADLLYEPYNSFYADHRPNHQVMQPGGGSNSLYSPTSPQSPLINQRPASAYGLNSSSRQQVNSAPAYYNNSSRFSMYHSPALTGGGVGVVGGGGGGAGSGGAKTSLAPTNEQLRRILGYQPHTKPIYLHPQWAYSRPFIHLQGTRSPSPGSPLFDPDDPDDRDIRPRFEPYNQLHDTQAIRAVDFHPSGEVYAVGSNSRALRICAYPADYELRHFGQDHVTTAPRVLFKFLQVHRGSIYCVRFNSTGQLLATGSNDQTVHIVRYNSVTHSPDGDEYRLTMHDGTVRDLCFIDDPTNGSSVLLSAGGGDNKIYVTDCDTITPFQSMAGHTQMIMALNHWGGANFVSASYDRTIRFWDLRTRACTSIISAPPGYGTAGKRVGPGAPACAVEVDSSGRLLASGHSDSTCMLYDIRGARIIQAFKPHDDEIRTVSFSPKSYYLLTGGYDGRIVLSDLQGDLTQPLPSVCVAESDDKIVQSKWHPSDFTFMTTSADKTATLWALPTE